MNRLIAPLSGSTLMVLAIAGIVDSARNDHSGLAILFGLLGVGVAGLAFSRSRSRAIVLRRDLARWVDQTSAVTGETADELTNRAVARLWASFSATGGQP
jgi:hypothetical protein